MTNSKKWSLRTALIGLALVAVAGCAACSDETPAAKPAAAPAAAMKPAEPAAAAPMAAPTTGYTGGAVVGGGTISGKVTFQGTAPKLPPEARNKDPKVCGTTFPNQTLLLGAGGGVKNVVVSLTDIHAGKPMAPGDAQLDQNKCSYAPHVQAVEVGTNLTVLNSDTILHNVHASLGAATVFNMAMPIHNQKIPTKLSKAGLIKLKCDVHGWMNGAIAVEDTPYFAVTGDDGSFTIADVPPGTYTVQAWHETLGDQTQKVTVAAGGKTTADLKYTVAPK
jgi:plastocyanin